MQDWDLEHVALARRAVVEGIVLIRIAAAYPLALYRAGAVKTGKGGIGSGDVNGQYSGLSCDS